MGYPGSWLLLFFVIAFLYSAVGHGGASGYLALMSILQVAPEHMKPVALILNLVVSGIAFIQFYRQGHFLWRLFLPIATLSIPMAYLGGFTPLKDDVYQFGLGVFLLVSVVLLNINLRGRISLKNDDDKRVLADDASQLSREYLLAAAVIGGGIGYVSGLLGIGGGILLSPVLLLLGWTQQKQTAAMGAAFIFVNSMSGLVGFVQQHPLWESTAEKVNDVAGQAIADGSVLEIYWLSVLMIVGAFITPVILGGVAGSWYGSKKFSHRGMKGILSVVLLIAAIKLLL
ncbi:MAG: TSUP family transporter [Bacteroidetes bacterium]|nr:TSUP family transporter [Bacteroidota bacterium]MDA1224841.1 TSUP family transporter [Bacteroidota bacterium]